MSDEFTATRIWRVSFRFKPTRDGIEHPGFVAVMNALQNRGWQPGLSQPDDDGWYVISCDGVEAERGDQAEAIVQSTAMTALASVAPARSYDDFNVKPTTCGEPAGGTWTGSGDSDDFTVRKPE